MFPLTGLLGLLKQTLGVTAGGGYCFCFNTVSPVVPGHSGTLGYVAKEDLELLIPLPAFPGVGGTAMLYSMLPYCLHGDGIITGHRD